jgi:trehalose 6-phosphate phosphatase
MTEAADKLDGFFRAFTGAGRSVLLLDYDGTLAPFRIDRFKARPWAGVRKLLMRIQNQGLTRLGIVTGRPAAEIAPLLGIDPALEVWGLHGFERLHADGRRDQDIISPETHAILDDLCVRLRGNPLGGLVEEKQNAVAMHWRGVTRARARAIERRTRELFEPLAQRDGLALLVFESGLELRAGRDKGEVVKALLEEIGGEEPVPIAYLGDDITDEPAFRAIREHGLGVLVRRQWRVTDADVWLRPPGELKAFLKRWLRACRTLTPARLAA